VSESKTESNFTHREGCLILVAWKRILTAFLFRLKGSTVSGFVIPLLSSEANLVVPDFLGSCIALGASVRSQHICET